MPCIQHIKEIDIEIIKNIGFDGGVKGILHVKSAAFKVVYRDYFPAGVYNPIFTHASIFVIIEFADVVVRWIAGGNNLNDKIRRAIAPFPIQLAPVTDNQKVRLDNRKRAVIEFYVKRGMEYLAGAFLAINVVVEERRQFGGNGLVDFWRAGHTINLPVKTSTLMSSGRASYSSKVIAWG